METRDHLILLADAMIRDKGYNSFSFKDLAHTIGIKTASIHYHFPTKADLGVAVITRQREGFKQFTDDVSKLSPTKKLKGLLAIYSQYQKENKICLVGSLSSDFNTVDESVKMELKKFSNDILRWLTSVLESGKSQKEFSFSIEARTQAILIITNMVAALQLARVNGAQDFELIKKAILNTIQH